MGSKWWEPGFLLLEKVVNDKQEEEARIIPVNGLVRDISKKSFNVNYADIYRYM